MVRTLQISGAGCQPVETVDEKISDWALLRRRGGKRLVIALSGVDGPPGIFAYYSSFARADCDQLLLNSPENGWYFCGIPLAGGGTSSLEATWRFLQDISAGYDETVLIGGSMGGYGALLYGSNLPKAHVLAMGPELYPGIQRGFFASKSQATDLPPNLSALFTRASFKPWILVGEKKSSDLFCLSEIVSDRVISLRNAHHAIPALLGGFLSGLHNVPDLLISGQLPQVLQPITGQMTRWPELSSLLYLMELGRVPLDRSCTWLDTLPANFYGRGYLGLQIALQFERQGRAHMALRYAGLARDVNPEDIETHLVHDRLWRAIHGVLPAPSFQAHVDPRHGRVETYHQLHVELCALHGLPEPRRATR